jgi:hypothetical protein
VPRYKSAAQQHHQQMMDPKVVAAVVVQEVFQELTKAGIPIPLSVMSTTISAIERKLQSSFRPQQGAFSNVQE